MAASVGGAPSDAGDVLCSPLRDRDEGEDGVVFVASSHQSAGIEAAASFGDRLSSRRSLYKPALCTQNTPLNTTGGHTWDAAYVLFDFLSELDLLGLCAEAGSLESSASDASSLRHLHLLELGSGSGWLGLNLANVVWRVLEPTMKTSVRDLRTDLILNITLTEQPGEALDWLAHNVQQFPHFCCQCPGSDSQLSSMLNAPRVHATSLDWAEADAHDLAWARDTNIIVGSDLIYNEIGAVFLPRIAKKLLEVMKNNDVSAEEVGSCRGGDGGGAHAWGSAVVNSGTKGRDFYLNNSKFLYAHTFHRYDHLDERFLAECHMHGLMVHEVKDLHTLVPVEEAFMEEIFPEKRIAILHITLAYDAE